MSEERKERRRRYWWVHVPDQPREVDGMVYETWKEAHAVMSSAIEKLTAKAVLAGTEVVVIIEPVWYTKAQFLTETLEVDA